MESSDTGDLADHTKRKKLGREQNEAECVWIVGDDSI